MDLPPFALDHWLAAHEFATPPIPYDLASSTGPAWSLGDLLALGGGGPRSLALSDLPVTYAPPEGRHELRAAIGEFHNVDPDWVLVTTGASEALSILLCLASRPGGNIVISSPAFPAFAAMAQAWGLKTRRYALRREDGFRQSAAGVLAAVDADTTLVLVNTPHNPTGSTMNRTEIGKLAAELKSRNVPLIVDEVYHPLYFGEAQSSAAGIDNVIVMSDMSKALSLAGLRMGWIIDADPERRKRVVDARSYFTISSSPILEAIAVHALGNKAQLLARLTTVASHNLTALAGFMKRFAGTFSWAEPAGGTIVFPWFRDGRDSRPFCQALASNGVLIVPGDCFDMPDHMRLGFGAQATGFDAALAIMAELCGRD
jgi:aspartate/methionine/tyrosine aminotransferase